MYICGKCSKIFKVQGSDKKVKCPNCSVFLYDMKILLEEWEQTGKDERAALKEKYCNKNEGNKEISATEGQGIKNDDEKDNKSNELLNKHVIIKQEELVANSESDVLTKEKNVVDAEDNTKSIPRKSSFFSDFEIEVPTKNVDKPQFTKVDQDSMVCPECGNNIPLNPKFCPECGYRFKKEKRKFKPIFVIIPAAFLLALSGILIFIFVIKPHKQNALENDKAVQTNDSGVAQEANESNEVEKENDDRGVLQKPYTIDELTQYAKNRCDELKKSGFSKLDYNVDSYGTGIMIYYDPYMNGDNGSSVISEDPMMIHMLEIHLSVDSTIDAGYEPIILSLEDLVSYKDIMQDYPHFILKGGAKTIDLTTRDVYVPAPEYDAEMRSFYSDIHAKLVDNNSYNSEQVEEILDLCHESTFSYKVIGSFTYEDKLPAEFGDYIREMTILYRELSSLYNGIPIE